MTSIPAPARNKLGKLIPRLASGHKGERIATVAAIGRTLDGAGLDFHDLASAVNALPKDSRRRAADPPTPDKAERRRRARQTRGPRWRDFTRAQAIAWLDVLIQDPGTPADARRFVEGIRDRLWDRPRTNVTSKEATVLTRHIRSAWQRGIRP